ncbi:Uncharacterized protein At1g65710 [Linum perenne]
MSLTHSSLFPHCRQSSLLSPQSSLPAAPYYSFKMPSSSSSGTPGKKSAARRRIGSKRSFDFDYSEEEDEDGDLAGDEAEDGRRQHHRRHSQSSRNSSPAGSRRISVQRNVGAASPRSQSPSRANNEGNQLLQKQPSPRKSSSRKVEHSPYRRNPLAEINPNLKIDKKCDGIDEKIAGKESIQKPNVIEQAASVVLGVPEGVERRRSARRS